MICENVLGSGSATPPGVEFWRTKIRFDPAGHPKMKKRTRVPICRPITLCCENEAFEKKRLGYERVRAPSLLNVVV